MCSFALHVVENALERREKGTQRLKTKVQFIDKHPSTAVAITTTEGTLLLAEKENSKYFLSQNYNQAIGT